MWLRLGLRLVVKVHFLGLRLVEPGLRLVVKARVKARVKAQG